MNRRQFAQAAGWTALSAGRVLGANDRVRLGAIGTGGRCRYLMNAANKVGGCEIVAINDVNVARLRKAKDLAVAGAKEHRDYRAVLDDKSIDAVLIGSPDHWHVPMLKAAVAAGKDAYCEKPLTKTYEEGREIIAAVNKTDRVVQVGYQQRSYPHMQEARAMIRGGALGRITLVQAYWYQNYTRFPIEPEVEDLDWKQWLGSAPQRAYDPLRYARWRWFWDYGGGTLTDLFSHWIDTIHWILDVDGPLAAQATGDHYAYDQFECPDTLRATFPYPKKFQVGYDSSIVYGYEDGGMIFRGANATLKLDRTRYELFTEDSIKEQRTSHPTATKMAPSVREGTLDHMQNFLECVRSRRTPNSDVVSAVASANVAHLGNRAYKTGKVVYPGGDKGEWKSLFNGKDLSGWIVDTKGLWTVRDGMIAGKHIGLKYNDFLRTAAHYEDFELMVKYRLVNNIGNSGVQFRSLPVEGSHEVFGYQADIGQQYWGCLYDESRRKKVLAGPTPDMIAGIDKNGWNEYHLRAEGNHIALWLNGIRTVDYVETEPGILRRGLIALQVHSGPGIEVYFKDLQIREL